MNVNRHRFAGVFMVENRGQESLATQSIAPGEAIYGEKIFRHGEHEYRLWAIRRSKLAAAISNGLNEMPILPGSNVLYLGAASGTTVSHVSDIVGLKGTVYAVEFSPPTARRLLGIAESRSNIIPIVEDARHPSRYSPVVTGPIEIVYQDVAQSDQAHILYENMASFCTIGAWGMIAIKARSIDSAASVEKIYRREIRIMEESGLQIVEVVNLAPYEKDHVMVIIRMTEKAT